MKSASRILVVDDDEDIRTALTEYLQRYGLQVVAVADGEEMRELLARQRFELIVLDVRLPGEDGLSLCRYVHEHLRIPVILLTAMSDLVDRVAGLELGAADYMSKPFEPRELVARIRCVLRRFGAAPVLSAGGRRYRFDEWELDLGRRELRRRNGQIVELNTVEFRLLRVMLEHPNTVLSREDLMELIRGGEAPAFVRGIDSQVSRLRRKLEDDARSPRLLRTARGDGYLLSAEVSRLPP